MSTQLAEKLNETLSRAVRPVTAEEIKKYKEEGYFLFRGLVSPEVAKELYADIMNIMNVIGIGTTKLRQTAQYLHGTLLETYIQSKLLHQVAESLMEAKAHLYLPFTAVKSGGGGGRFHFHQDGNYTKFKKGTGINLWLALVPMRTENGALRIVPRSHKGGEIGSENVGEGDTHVKVKNEPENSEVIEMEPGDVVAFTRYTVHGSGPNNTDAHRVAYAVQYFTEDAVAVVNGREQVLRDEPRFTDIWGVDEIIPDNAGSRDGH
ncbi:MAG: phytanoyl-CoA dioxygenase family protein [Chthoniobacterales bacterium]